jgi:hypothetical protein
MITVGQILGSILIAFFVDFTFNRGKPTASGFLFALAGSVAAQFAINAVMP